MGIPTRASKADPGFQTRQGPRRNRVRERVEALVCNRIWQKCLGRVALALVITAALFPTGAMAGNYLYSIVLDRTGADRNYIYSLREGSGTIAVTSTRLRDALDALDAPHDVLVNSYSVGMGTHDYENDAWHGALLWSVTPNSKGMYPTDLYYEPYNDRRSDLYISPHERNTEDGFLTDLNLKAAEENTADLPHPIHQLLATPTLGIAGGQTGHPTATSPDNLVGFDARLTPSGGTIYFTISKAFGAFKTSDVLCEENGVITVWVDSGGLGINAADKIDALDVDAMYHLFRDLEPSFLYSLSADSPSVGPGLKKASDLYHHIVGAGAFSELHRSAFASGAAPDNSDIDTVVSIDPAESQAILDLNLEINVDDDDGTVWLGYDQENEITVFWDFQLETIIPESGGFGGRTTKTLEPGDEVRLDLFIEIDGRVFAHHEVIKRTETTANLATDLQAFVGRGGSTLVVTSTATVGEWDFVVDGVKYTTPVTQSTLTLPLAPGFHVAEVHYVDVNDRSAALRESFVVPSGMAPPANVTATPLNTDPPRYRLDWTVEGAGMQSVQIVVQGPNVDSAVLVAGNSWETDDLSLGCYRYQLRRVSGSGTSAPVSISVCVTDQQVRRIDDHLVVDGGTQGAPGDSAYLDGSGEVVSVDTSRSGGDFIRYSINARSFEFATITPGAAIDTLHAVTSILDQQLGAMSIAPMGGPPGTGYLPGGVKNRLLWVAVDAGGGDMVVMTEEDGTYVDHTSLSVNADDVSAMAYDPSNHRLIMVVNGQLHEVDLPVDMITAAELVAQPMDVLNSMVADSVTMVESGYYEVSGITDIEDGVTHLATLATADDEVVSSIPFSGPISVVSGMVYGRHGAAARPSYYISEGTLLVEYFGRDPRGIHPSPSASYPFHNWNRFGDLDGDGFAFMQGDFDFLALVLSDPTRADALPCQASLDLNQDGIFDAEDCVIFTAAQGGTLPTHTCLPLFSTVPCNNPSCQ